MLKYSWNHLMSKSKDLFLPSQCRVLPDITSGPEVRQIVKIRTVWKLDVFLSGRRTFINGRNFFKNWKKNQNVSFKTFFLFICFWHQIWAQGPYLLRIDNQYLASKMFRNVSPDSVRSGRTCLANFGVRSCPVRKLICPVPLSPMLNDWCLTSGFRFWCGFS